MTLDQIINAGINPALYLLPSEMDSKAARVQLLAIGLQESLFEHRRQLVGKPPKPVGPANSFWQGERGGGMVQGVRTHHATAKPASALYSARGVAANNQAIWDAIEVDDVLAAGLARLLLWSDPLPMPKVGDEEGAWQLYLRTWRPGAWTNGNAAQRAKLRSKWSQNYAKAVEAVK